MNGKPVLIHRHRNTRRFHRISFPVFAAQLSASVQTDGAAPVFPYIMPVSSSFLWKNFIIRISGLRNTVPKIRKIGKYTHIFIRL